MNWIILLISIVLVVVAMGWLKVQWTRWRPMRLRTATEDALKLLYVSWQADRLLTLDALAGGLGWSPRRALELLEQMEQTGLVRSKDQGMELTEQGQQLATQITRTHRLLERYLADEAGWPLGSLHHMANRIEHQLTDTQVEALNEHLGHPQVDPHGDPIPQLGHTPEPLLRQPLTDWPEGDTLAQVVHIEDEPAAAMRQVLAIGLRPGVVLKVQSRQGHLLELNVGGVIRTLPAAVALGVHVKLAEQASVQTGETMKLATLSRGKTSHIVYLADSCRGLARRRLLDLGFTPGAKVQATFSDAVGATRAYRIRDTLIALRREQADQILVRPCCSPVVESN